MDLLTEDAIIVCAHQLGKANVIPTQDLLKINKRRVLLEREQENCSIVGSPVPPSQSSKPCKLTLPAIQSYSNLIRVEGRRVCLDKLTRMIDGTPPGTVQYKLQFRGQNWVSEGP